jgi:uncharacterized protein (DUF2384 family)
MLSSAALKLVLDHIQDEAELDARDIAAFVQVPAGTVALWTGGKAAPDLEAQAAIVRLRHIAERLSGIYTPSEARRWLHAPHRLLEGRRAIDLVKQGQIGRVVAALAALRTGAYT